MIIDGAYTWNQHLTLRGTIETEQEKVGRTKIV
jgi:hypothetical protein